jgi:hypothetical protein
MAARRMIDWLAHTSPLGRVALGATGTLGVVGIVWALIVILGGNTVMSPWGPVGADGVEIAPCIVAVKVRPDGDDAGLLVVRGPGGVEVEGRYTYRAADDWTVDIIGGSGTVGGLTLRPDDFSGAITRSGGLVTSTVEVQLSTHPQLVDGWEQEAVLRVPYRPETCARGGELDSAAAPERSVGGPGPLALAALAAMPAGPAAPAAVPATTSPSEGGLSWEVNVTSEGEGGDFEMDGDLAL